MPTIFIALQCCQCSTMQVKQQKNSNKWSCVVCNQKQSVRKVYAQGFMAKDVRKFVQNFNMSRQLAEQKQLCEEDQKETQEIEDQFPNNVKKRTDWSEYIDPEEEDDFKSRHADEKFGEEFESKIVTEIPKAVFRKPKLKNYSAKFNTAVDEEDEFEPKIVTEMLKAAVFKKPKLKNYSATVNTAADQVLESSRWLKNRLAKELLQPTSGTSKWKSFSNQEDDGKFEEEGRPRRNQATAAKSASKWSCYITEDSNDLLQPASGRDLKVQTDPFEINELNDQTVEEDIHPDFL